MNMKFDYENVEDRINQINKSFKIINTALMKLEEGFSFMSDNGQWNSKSCDYFRGELKSLENNIDNVNLISNNVNAYLESVLTNYKQFDDHANSLFSGLFKGGK